MWTEVAAARQKREDHAGAMAAWSRTRALRRQLGHDAGELEALEGLGAAARRHAADPSVSLAYYHEAVQLAQALEDHAAEGRLRNTVGILEWGRGEYAQALQHYERAFTIFEELGYTADAGLMLNSICITLKSLGRVADATGRLEGAVALHREMGQRQLEAHGLAALGDISSELGQTAAAVEYYQRSLEIRREIADVRGEGWMLYNLVRCDAAAEQARDLIVRASQVAEECGDHELAAACEELRPTAR
jgi:tetratricopeptide (TPR) repeat protein